jgi:DNA-binding XRE family transcriptional regulator
LRFRNIDASPDDPVSAWGFEGMLAAIDRGYARDWRKLVDAVAADPSLRPLFDEATRAAESRSTVLLLDRVLARATESPSERALERLREAYRGTRMTQTQLATALGTSRTRLNSYLNGRVTPSMDVLVAVEQIADCYRAPSEARDLVLT